MFSSQTEGETALVKYKFKPENSGHVPMLKRVCCFLSFCFLLILIGVLLFQYYVLNQSHFHLNSTFIEKLVNETKLEAKIEELTNANRLLNDEIIALENKVQSEMEKLKNAEDEMKNYTKMIEELNDERATLKSNLENETEKLKKAQEKIDSQLKSIEELKKDILTLSLNLEEETKKLNMTQDQVDSHMNTITNLTKEVASLSANLQLEAVKLKNAEDTNGRTLKELKDHLHFKAVSSNLINSSNKYPANISSLFMLLFVSFFYCNLST